MAVSKNNVSKIKKINQKMAMKAATSTAAAADEFDPDNTTTGLPTKLKEFDASNVSYASQVKITNRILAEMKARTTGKQGSVMLLGDPGTGKTSYVRKLATLLGVELVLIEVPHLAEEHIVNIPFIVINPSNDKAERIIIDGKEVTEERDYRIVLAQSNLYSRLKRSRRIPDKDYINYIYKNKPHMVHARKLYEQMGGTRTKVPKAIQFARQHFSKILFLDEYYRKTSNQIRNSLRSIVNGELGLDKLPRHVYPIFASNMNDGDSTEASPSNERLDPIIMDNPSKDEWFGYLVSEAEAQGQPLSTDVINMMYTVIKPEWLSYGDTHKDLRVSPRRWEQLILYLNQSLPPKNKKIARQLLTNLSINFTHFDTGEELSEIKSTIMLAAAKLINDSVAKNCVDRKSKDKDIACYKVGADERTSKSDWLSILRHQVVRKLMLGNRRKYVPVLSGLPGIGKTMLVAKMAKQLGLGCVHVDCSSFTYEDVLGTPLASKEVEAKLDGMTDEEAKHSLTDNAIKMYFSESKLCQIIYDGVKKNPPAPEYANTEHYKYIIFLDELNRVKDVRVFNAIRKLLLEEKFDNDMPLPQGSLIIAAINPSDAGTGVIPMTQHMRDVLDIIPCLPTWEGQIQYMMDREKDPSFSSSVEFPDIIGETVKIIERLNRAFMNENSKKEGDKNFWLDLEVKELYFPPRDYSDLHQSIVHNVDGVISRFLEEKGVTSLAELAETPEVLETELDPQLREAFYDSYMSALHNVFNANQEALSKTYLKTVWEWVMDPNNVSYMDSLTKIGPVLNDVASLASSAIKSKKPFLDVPAIADIAKKCDENFQSDIERLLESSLLTTDAFNDFSYPYRVWDDENKELVVDDSYKLNSVMYAVNELSLVIKANNLSNLPKERLAEAVRAKFLSDKELMKKFETINLNIENGFKSDDEFEQFLAKYEDLIAPTLMTSDAAKATGAKEISLEDAKKIFREEAKLVYENEKKNGGNKPINAKFMLYIFSVLMGVCKHCSTVTTLLCPKSGTQTAKAWAVMDAFFKTSTKGGKRTYKQIPSMLA